MKRENVKKIGVMLLMGGILPLSVYADLGDEGLDALAAGRYGEAAQLLGADITANPGSKEALGLYGPLGEALIGCGDLAGARRALAEGASKGSPQATLMMGRLCYEEYDFEGAAEWYGKYGKLKNKGYEQTDFRRYEKQLEMAEDFLRTVEKIVIVDSIVVPKETFFEAYRLPASAGKLLPNTKAPKGAGEFRIGPVFESESGDFMLWGQEDESGQLTVEEAVRLTGGGWHLETAPKDVVNGGKDAAYPFMMSDGTTLYFANDGEESIGGMDIFIASRDATTGEYMKPQNIGMPYNSPADDYLLAIDEENGVGWWASDRNHIPGKVTVYVFLPNEVRNNYDGETDDVLSLARISSIHDTWGEENYSTRVSEIKKIRGASAKKTDFIFPVSGGKVYHTLEEMPAGKARTAMQAYLEGEKTLAAAEEKLSRLRRDYASNKGLKQEVIRLEREVEGLRNSVKKLRNQVYGALRK